MEHNDVIKPHHPPLKNPFSLTVTCSLTTNLIKSGGKKNHKLCQEISEPTVSHAHANTKKNVNFSSFARQRKLACEASNISKAPNLHVVYFAILTDVK